MKKIDSHHHFWKYDAQRDSWITPEMSAIRKDFLPSDLQPILEKHGFVGCVAVQTDQSEHETGFLVAHAEKNTFVKGVVGWTDLQAEDLEEKLQEYKKQPLIKGFRHILQGEMDRAMILRDEFKRGLDLLGRYGYTYDVLIFPDQMPFLKEFLKTSELVPMVIDHIAKPNIKTGEIDQWLKYIHKVAEFDNVACKVSGMITEADWKAWKYGDFVPYLDIVFNAFGPERLMFGSDWPVCELAGGYDKAVSVAERYTSLLTDTEQSGFWGQNAINFYKLAD